MCCRCSARDSFLVPFPFDPGGADENRSQVSQTVDVTKLIVESWRAPQNTDQRRRIETRERVVHLSFNSCRRRPCYCGYLWLSIQVARHAAENRAQVVVVLVKSSRGRRRRSDFIVTVVVVPLIAFCLSLSRGFSHIRCWVVDSYINALVT